MADDTWTVAVTVPASLPGDMLDALFTAVADAAHEWEPEQRDGWDIDVTGGPSNAAKVRRILTRPDTLAVLDQKESH